MKNKNKVWLLLTTVFLTVVASIVNFFIWPFEADSPNYSDVDKAYKSIRIPEDWKLISTTENKGTAGRTCPIESSGCFSKRGLYSLPEGTDVSDITEFLSSAGCKSITSSDTSSESKKRYSFYCDLAGKIKLGSDYRLDDREATVIVSTD